MFGKKKKLSEIIDCVFSSDDHKIITFYDNDT